MHEHTCTGVPGAAWFSQQSDIYRNEKEGRGGEDGRRRSVMISVVLTN